MAPTPLTVAAHEQEETGDFTDEQIHKILAEAAVRLKARDAARDTTAETERSKREFPKLNPGKMPEPYLIDDGTFVRANPREMVDDRTRKLADVGRKVEAKVFAEKAAREKKKADAGGDWYNLPKTDLTPELKRDLQLLHMRSVLDPHRHYKKDGGKMKAPEYSQVGTIVEGPTEFFSGRVENKKRKRTLVEEVLAGEQETGRFKKKYGEVQSKKTSGKKAFYKELKAKRKGGIKK